MVWFGVGEESVRYRSDIRDRAFNFAVRCIDVARFLEKQSGVSRVLANQLLRSATSVGANLEEARAAESRADFLHKMRIAQKEAREANYWLRLIQESYPDHRERFRELTSESSEILKVISKIIVNTLNNRRQQKE